MTTQWEMLVMNSLTTKPSGTSGEADPKPRLTRLNAFLSNASPAESDELHATREVPAAGETLTPGAIRNLARSSITTIEELLGLDRVDRRSGTCFVASAGVPRKVVEALRNEFAATPEGAQELADWSRLEKHSYGLGLDLEETGELDSGDEKEIPASGTLNPAVTCITAVRDQQDRGTCTAFASVACLEYHRCRSTGTTEPLSEQFQYWNMVRKTGVHTLAACFPLLQTDGVCRATTWPYNGEEIDGDDGQGPPPTEAIAEAGQYRCAAVLRLPARSVREIREALTDERLVAVGFPVYRSWLDNPVVRKYGNITLPFPGEVPEHSGHAVVLVGFAEDEDFSGGGYFIVRNSWDAAWGTHSVFGSGYGTLPFAYVERFNWDAWCVAG